MKIVQNRLRYDTAVNQKQTAMYSWTTVTQWSTHAMYTAALSGTALQQITDKVLGMLELAQSITGEVAL